MSVTSLISFCGDVNFSGEVGVGMVGIVDSNAASFYQGVVLRFFGLVCLLLGCIANRVCLCCENGFFAGKGRMVTCCSDDGRYSHKAPGTGFA